MNPNQALWNKGDFTQIADTMRDSGAAIVQALGIAPPLRALDLGCGDGTTALPLAQLGADVTGIDLTPKLVEAGNRRAAAAGLGSRLRFQQGDACQLEGVEDQSFDLTLSVFGAMFAPRPFDVAREMVRVTKPGGLIVMGNWIPNHPTFVSQLLRVCSGFTPAPPEGFISPMLWGVESHIQDRFGQAGVPAANIVLEPQPIRFLLPDRSPADFIELFHRYYGPTMNAFEAAEGNGRGEELQRQMVELAQAENRHPGGGTDITATFLRVTVTAPGADGSQPRP